ncbi:MAG: hypothetical protein IJ301_00235 [Clostridia bacterium]|nr:hypothetical protein [Clostridia bacterium]
MNDTKKITSSARAKRKRNMIASIVCFSIVGVLILTTILLAVIPAGAGVRYENKPDQIHVKIGTTQYQLDQSEATKTDFDLIWNAYTSAGSPSVIATIFGGYAGNGMAAHYSASTSSYSSLATDETFAIAFIWNDAQTMINADGSNFVYKSGSATFSETKFYEAHFAVTSENAVKDTKIYLNTNASNSSKNTNFTYTGVTNFYGLYNVLNQMVEDGKFTNFAG